MSGPNSTSRKCGSRKPSGGPCQRPAGDRTGHHGWGWCWLHRGNTPNGIKYAVRQMVEAGKLVFLHADVPHVAPERVLLDEVRRSAAIVQWLQLHISQWRVEPETPEQELARIAGTDPDGPDTGSERLDLMHVSKSTGLPALGTVVTFDRGGTVAPTEVSAWLAFYQQERAHLARVAKMAIDTGVAERLVRLAETEVDTLVGVIRASFAEMGIELTPERVAIVGRQLRAVPGHAS